MSDYPHLILPKAEVDMERRKRRGFGAGVPREQHTHSKHLEEAVGNTLAARQQLRTTVVDPRLIVRVRTAGFVSEEDWLRAGLVMLGQDDGESVVLFSSDGELTEFRRRLAAYAEPMPEGQSNPAYASLIGAIEEFRALEPRDRIGPQLRDEGFSTINHFADATRRHVVDVELWDIGSQALRLEDVERIQAKLAELDAEITDRYVGHSFTVLRVHASGAGIQWLLTVPSVRLIDLPPRIDLEVGPLLKTTVQEMGTVEPPDADAPIIGILDSGVNDAHPLLTGVVIDRVGVPATLGLSDDFGHGTKVSGVAAYGDVRECLQRGFFKAPVRLFSGKIVNNRGLLEDKTLIASQMDQVVRELYKRGCRIFNLSVGDRNRVYGGAKVGTWTAVLDELARELDVLFVVSAGNYEHGTEQSAEEHLTGYPRYLLTAESRVIEPATAASALTVGAVATAAALGDHMVGSVGLRPIAGMGEPAPFTRAGFGVSGAIKPELCDDGGNTFYDGLTLSTRRMPESGVLTMSPQYLDGLFTTGFGTSYAAPLVAHKAALLLRAMPDASANLLRALLANSARVPEPAENRLKAYGADAVSRLCGFGIANSEIASQSDRNRVVLYADDAIGMDKFFVYEIPVPKEYSQTDGRRQIKVSLAYDPPTRHTRAAYLGLEMSFRLIRGRSLRQVEEHFRQRNAVVEGPAPEVAPSYNCKFDVGPRVRERSTLQTATFRMSRNPPSNYGDIYHLVVRCERQWFPDEFALQRFAVVVEMSHAEDIDLYERVRERIFADRVRVASSTA